MSQVIILLLLLFSINCHATIGAVTEGKGNGEIIREKSKLDAKLNTSVESMDVISTANGVFGITFKDDTKVKVTEHSKLVIDDFVYDPKSKGAGKLVMKVALGTVRYASGSVAKENSKNVNIKTPTATVAVRGTAFTMTVDEIGQSLVILLPNVDGSIGEIEVITSAGSVIMNKAFQATMVSGSEVKPLKPVILNLSESMIDNMLIVKPPKEILKKIQEEILSQSDALNFTELDKNLLDIKIWKDDLKFDELNINQLESNYLDNVLDNIVMNQFQAGFYPNTQVYIFDKSSYWQIDRRIKQNATFLIHKEKSYNIKLTQDATTIYLKNSDSANNNMTIKQVSK